MKVLVGAGANVDAVENNGRSALMHASYAGSVPAVRSLLSADASATLGDKEGRNIAAWASMCADASAREAIEALEALLCEAAADKAMRKHGVWLRETEPETGTLKAEG